MSDIQTNDTPELPELPVPDQLTTLKARADLLGISYHPSIGVDKLREKIAAAMADPVPGDSGPTLPAADGADAAAEAAPQPVEEESEGAKRARLRRQANELIRIRVTCMNPNKKEWEGEIFTAGNGAIGSFTKFVPFNVEDGWHVPRVIYNQIVQRQCQIFTTTRDGRGNSVRTGKLIKEFAIEVLPNLTTEELHELAARQAATKAID